MGEKVRKKKTKVIAFLPEDIITNILSRLPAKKASQCRLVCKRWRDLTLTRDFVELHFRHNTFPMILVSNPRRYKSTIDFFLLDKWWELPARKKLMIHKFKVDYGNITTPLYACLALFSHVGLVVYYSGGGSLIVGNPMDPGNVTITLSKEIDKSEIYGVFFHPSLKEFCSLWMILKSNEPFSRWSHPKWIKYKILTLGSNPSMRTISNPFSYRVTRDSYPVFIHKYLYWMLEPENDECKYSGHSDIMQFDIIREEFTVIPCPVPLDTKMVADNTDLLNIDGILSFLLILPRKITIWRLEDHAQQVWTTANYTFPKKLYQGNGVPSAIAIVDGKLALFSDGRLIVCNLLNGTIYYRKMQYNHLASILFHQMSLASLTNCTSQIFIDQEGEVVQIVSEG